jgi:hypothetical protein
MRVARACFRGKSCGTRHGGEEREANKGGMYSGGRVCGGPANPPEPLEQFRLWVYLYHS